MHQIASEAREIQGWKAKLLRHFPVVPTNKPSRNGWIDIYVLIYASTCPNSKHKTSNIVPLIFLTHQDQHRVARVPWAAGLVVHRLGPVEEACRVWGEHLIIFLFCRIIIPLLANYIYTVFGTAEECVPLTPPLNWPPPGEPRHGLHLKCQTPFQQKRRSEDKHSGALRRFGHRTKRIHHFINSCHLHCNIKMNEKWLT